MNVALATPPAHDRPVPPAAFAAPRPAAAPARAERRRHARTRTYMVATVNYGNLLLPCFVLDLSAGGGKVKMFDSEPLPDGPCELECGRAGIKVQASIAWFRAGFAGLKFATPVALDPKRIAG
jgi:hypothetical protein